MEKAQAETGKKRRKRRHQVAFVGILLMLGILGNLLSVSKVVQAQDYNFGSETVNKGYTINPANKNAEDASYEDLYEGDQYADTNFSGSSENVVVGTGGGAGFPTALNTDDASRRTYTEANTGGGSPTYQILRPTSDGSVVTLVEYPVSPATDYDKIDETTAGGDADTTYLEGVTNGQDTEMGMSDPSDPGGSPNIDVTMWHISRGESTSACTVVWGIEIGGVEYQGGSTTMTSITYANFSYEWTTNPAGGEWTLSTINGLETYVRVTDANPDTRTTQVALLIEFNPVASYQFDAQITYSGVTSTAQTISYNVLCQGYRNGDTENIGVYAWNYVSLGWDLKATISAGSDTDYNFDLTTQQRDSGANEVKLRLVDASNGDATQTTVWLDLLKVNRIERGFALDVEMTASSVNQYGNERLRIKGYTSSETFDVKIYNWGTTSYDSTTISITALSNTWYTWDMDTSKYRSGSYQVKIQFLDGTSYTADTTQDVLHLDVAWVTWIHADPVLSQDGCNGPKNVGEAIDFWVTVTDADNEMPTYVRLSIGVSNLDMIENSTGDTTTVDGKAWYLQKSDLAGGVHDYFFKTKDANSGEIATSAKQVAVNRIPTLTDDGVTPAAGNNGDMFSFFVVFDDADLDLPTYMKVHIDSTDYDAVKNDSEDNTPPIAYHYDKQMSGGDHTYYFKTADYLSGNVQTTTNDLDVNNKPTLNVFTREPSDPCYPTTTIYFNCTFTDLDDELPSAIKWRENAGAVQNLSMSEVDLGDSHTNDGKVYTASLTLSHGSHEYDFYATDGHAGADVTGGDNSVNIQNRDPEITNKIVDDHEWRNIYWEHDYSYSEPDEDTVSFEMVTNASFLNINSGSGLVYGTTSDPVGWYDVQVWCNDSYGGTDTDLFVLYVDNREPVITNGPGAHVDEYRNEAWFCDFDANDPDTDTVSWQKSGPAWLNINSGTGNISGTTSDTPGLYSFVVYANDSYGGSDNYAFDLDIFNRVPVIDSTGNTTQEEDSYMAYLVVAHDDDSDSLSIELSTDAPFLSLDGFWLNGSATPIGDYEYTLWVNDSYGGSDSEHQFLEVTSGSQAPYFTSTPIYSVANNSAYLYDSNATDPDDPPDLLTYGLETDNGYLSINPSTGEISGTPHQAGTFFIHANVTDGTYIIWQNFSFEVTSTPPSFTSSPIEEWQNNTMYFYDVNASDPENEVLFWLLEGNGTAFLQINSTTGVVNGSLPSMGYWWVNASVTEYTHTIWQNFTVTALNSLPIWTTSPVTSATKGVPYYYDANVSDMNSDHIHFEVEGPGWLFVDLHTGEVEGTPNENGNFEVNLTGFDGIGYVWQVWTLTVPNGAPYFVSSPGTIAKVGELYVYHAEALDPEEDPLLYSISEGLPGFTIDETTGTFQGIPTFQGDCIVSLRVFDGYTYAWQNFTLKVDPDPKENPSDSPLFDDSGNRSYWIIILAGTFLTSAAALIVVRRSRVKKRRKKR